MTQKLNYLKESPSQTAGPYVHIGLAPGAAGFDIYREELGWDIAGPNAKGEPIRVEGIVIDGTGSPIKDVLLEAWQANSAGVYPHPEHPGEVEEGFRGWGRVITDFATGEWGFDTVKPGPVMGRNGRMMRRISTSGLSRAASMSASTPASISRTRPRQTPPTRS